MRRQKHAVGLALALLVGCAATVGRAEIPANDAQTTAAREILAAHCPPCYEVNRRKRSGVPSPSLDLAAITRDPNLIRPGNPDGSPVYTTLVRQLLTSSTSPSIEQLATLRTWIEQLPASRRARTNGPVRSSAINLESTSEPIELQLHADRPRYKVGDEIRFIVRSNVDCRLHVISIDVSGHGTVIFPNDFAPEEQISAGTDLAVPAFEAGYRLRVKERGRERVVALCTRAAGLIDGIRHDFERQRFQELGIYATFLDNALRDAVKRKAEGAEDPAHAPLHEIWRTGILIDVE